MHVMTLDLNEEDGVLTEISKLCNKDFRLTKNVMISGSLFLFTVGCRREWSPQTKTS